MSKQIELFTLPQFTFDNPIVSMIVDLEKLRVESLSFLTRYTINHPNGIFLSVKQLFKALESVGSARIEGNNTTIAEYLIHNEDIAEGDENVLEIRNIEMVISRLDNQYKSLQNSYSKSATVSTFAINHQFIKELHFDIVHNLHREGSVNPGSYRTKNVAISGSSHTPPLALSVQAYMDKLIDFINEPTPSQYDLIKIAMVHHAFVWIHPFDNGNGRTVRVLTYALMLKYGFKNFGIVMNPIAVFCADRHVYYDKLQEADTLTNEGILVWCSYVLAAVKTGYDKTVRLSDHGYVQSKIIKPSFQQLVTLGLINGANELQIMEKISTLTTFKKSDILEYCNNDKAASRKLTELRERNFIEFVKDGGKLYQFNYNNRVFLRVVAEQLAKEDMLPRNIV